MLGVMYPQFRRGSVFWESIFIHKLDVAGFRFIILLPSVKDVSSAPAEQGILHVTVSRSGFVTGLFLISRSRSQTLRAVGIVIMSRTLSKHFSQ